MQDHQNQDRNFWSQDRSWDKDGGLKTTLSVEYAKNKS